MFYPGKVMTSFVSCVELHSIFFFFFFQAGDLTLKMFPPISLFLPHFQDMAEATEIQMRPQHCLIGILGVRNQNNVEKVIL